MVNIDLPSEYWELTVQGQPVSKQRPRYSTRLRRMYTPKETSQQEKRIAAEFKAKYPEFKVDSEHLWCIIVQFYCATKRRRDADNMLKLVSDALNGVVWNDDSQIREMHVKLELGCCAPETDILVFQTGQMKA